ncbi:hypothetical protein ACIRL3_46145 [Streptomyces sp. NPDC102384]|uniref:hypothetical protein n=1 Tax=unclassified Streptomyces TaxID=2593676 RepID=UPI0037F6B9A6
MGGDTPGQFQKAPAAGGGAVGGRRLEAVADVVRIRFGPHAIRPAATAPGPEESQ